MSRDSYLRVKWGITEEQYNGILKQQRGGCAICERPPTTVSLAVDHDHITGRIRGLLCYRCNHFLVGRHRDPDLVQRIADYLRGGTEYYAPKGPNKTKRKPKRVHRKKRK
jgi:hypothetical protein